MVEFRLGSPGADPPSCVCFLDGLSAGVYGGTQLLSLSGSIGLDALKHRGVFALAAGEFRFCSLSPTLQGGTQIVPFAGGVALHRLVPRPATLRCWIVSAERLEAGTAYGNMRPFRAAGPWPVAKLRRLRWKLRIRSAICSSTSVRLIVAEPDVAGRG